MLSLRERKHRALTRTKERREGRKLKQTLKGERERLPTPADEYVPPEVFLLEDKGESKQRLQVHALHQKPEVVG